MRSFVSLLLLIVLSFPSRGQDPGSSVNTADWTKLPYDRLLNPAGKLITLGDSTRESHALDAALSPDERWLAVEERYSIAFIDTRSNQVAFSLRLDSIPGLKYAMCTYSGITWYRRDNSDFVLFSASRTSSVSFVVMLNWDGRRAITSKVYAYKPLKPASLALPNELLVMREGNLDCLYVVLNGNNQLVKQNLLTGDTLWIADTGVAPYGIALANNKLYITNWAGRMPLSGDPDVAGIPWGSARIDPANAGTREGSIGIFDPVTGKQKGEVVTGLHPNKILASPDGKFVYLTCSNSDQVTAIDTRTDHIAEIISLRLLSASNPYSGDTPNGLAVTPDGKTLFVANGMDNAVAVITLGSGASSTGKTAKSGIEGFIPTAAFPSSVCLSKRKTLYVTNLESFGATEPFAFLPNHAPVFNSHHMKASVSVIRVPKTRKLAEYNETVIAANQISRLKDTQLPPRPGIGAKPVPERIGEPSVFKHVLYIIKENRTYDQIFGDISRGDGDSTLCSFGGKVTPNMHRLADEFHLMDNFFVSGKCSAEGHSWTDASIVTDYIEKNVRAWFRSYPHVLNDAMGYPSTGFLWDNARKHGVSVRIYGEAAVPVFDNKITWSDIYTDFLEGRRFEFQNQTTLNTVKDILAPGFPAYDGHKIPDVLRAQAFIEELKHFESMPGDALPQLMVMALPNDHTGGTRPGLPTPRAMVADNDLALGRIIEAVSKSRFWENTVVFVVEDDSQDGWDHVSSYRTAALVISPWSHLTKVVHEPYNQPSMVRTIEQILGLPPMNIQDAIAIPMTACFGDQPDFRSYAVVPNQIPLDEMNKSLSALSGKALHYARLSLDPQFDGVDKGNDELFNRILWHATMGDKAYPAFLPFVLK
jgi:DNA-binding beta-propeller fold protein YncE